MHADPQLPWIDESERNAAWPFDSPAPIQSHVDTARQWVVQVFRAIGADGTEYDGSLRVGIKAHETNLEDHLARGGKGVPAGAEILATWSQLQAIKDHFWPHRVALEIYPPKHRIVDVAPMRWLWILPAGHCLPFNLATDGEPLRSGETPELAEIADHLAKPGAPAFDSTTAGG